MLCTSNYSTAMTVEDGGTCMLQVTQTVTTMQTMSINTSKKMIIATGAQQLFVEAWHRCQTEHAWGNNLSCKEHIYSSYTTEYSQHTSSVLKVNKIRYGTQQPHLHILH